MEENKGSNNMCENCKDKKEGMCCGHRCCGKRSHRIISVIIVIAIAFLFGTMVGERSNFQERSKIQRFMVNNGYDYSAERDELNNNAVDSATVNVLPPTTGTSTTTPPVRQ